MSVAKEMGTCNICGQHFDRGVMTRHLKICGKELSTASTPANKPRRQSFHLVVEGRFDKMYWMHLAVPADSPLITLDAYLRRMWLECCGHMSGFTIGGVKYASQVMEEFAEEGMGKRLDRILAPGMSFNYEYDYGSTTELKMKVIGFREPGAKKRGIELLARNDAPQRACQECGSQPATLICSECAWDDKGWLCGTCADDHACDSEMFLPVVNSPRVGVCGYTG